MNEELARELEHCKVIDYFQYRTMMIEFRRVGEPQEWHDQILLRLPNGDHVKLCLFTIMAKIQNSDEDGILEEFMRLRESGFTISEIQDTWEEEIDNFYAEEDPFLRS